MKSSATGSPPRAATKIPQPMMYRSRRDPAPQWHTSVQRSWDKPARGIPLPVPGAAAAAGKVIGGIDMKMTDLRGIPVPPKDEPPVGDDPAPDAGREGDVYQVPAAGARTEDTSPRTPAWQSFARRTGSRNSSPRGLWGGISLNGRFGCRTMEPRLWSMGPHADIPMAAGAGPFPGSMLRVSLARWSVMIFGESPVVGVEEVTFRIILPGP